MMTPSTNALTEERTEPGIDAVEDYWNARPCNVRHSPKPVGSREYFDEVEQRKHFVEYRIPGFAQFERWRGKRVLEVGCGIGTAAVNFARGGAEYTGVELSKASLRPHAPAVRCLWRQGRSDGLQCRASERACGEKSL